MEFCPESEIGAAEELVVDAKSVQLLAPEDEIDYALYLQKEEGIASETQPKEQDIAQTRRQILDLYEEFRPQLLRYIRSLYLKRDQAEEVIQETFLRLATQLAHGSPIDNTGGWIIRVAHNLAINALKKEEMEHAYITDATSVELETFVDPQAGPYEIYRKKERARRMKEELSKLNPQQRQCFQLRVQGFVYKEIGYALGISEQRAAAVLRKVTSRLVAVCR